MDLDSLIQEVLSLPISELDLLVGRASKELSSRSRFDPRIAEGCWVKFLYQHSHLRKGVVHRTPVGNLLYVRYRVPYWGVSEDGTRRVRVYQWYLDGELGEDVARRTQFLAPPDELSRRIQAIKERIGTV